MSQMMSGIKVGKKTSVLHSSQFESKLSDHLSMYFLSAIIIFRVGMQKVSSRTMYGEIYCYIFVLQIVVRKILINSVKFEQQS